jgi:hypothetical protein
VESLTVSSFAAVSDVVMPGGRALAASHSPTGNLDQLAATMVRPLPTIAHHEATPATAKGLSRHFPIP